VVATGAPAQSSARPIERNARALHVLFGFRQLWRSCVMTVSSETQGGLGPASELEPLRAKSGWIVALGVVFTIAGVIALGSVVMATQVSVLIVGIMMIIAGVAEVINAFQVKGWGRFLFWLLLGALYIFAGFVTFENPLLAAAVLTLLLGASLVASGIVRIFVAFAMRGGAPWFWVALSGVITLLLGLVILVHWPVSSLYILGLFLGIDLLMAGACWIGLGLGLRRATSARA
jgi:uncharacterized membrane protein HdeD (DUF308 family)